jgi:hypothetical protein
MCVFAANVFIFFLYMEDIRWRENSDHVKNSGNFVFFIYETETAKSEKKHESRVKNNQSGIESGI